MRLRGADRRIFKALAEGALTDGELEVETGLSRRAIAESLERLTCIGAVERVIDYTMGPRRVRWRRLIDDEELDWLLIRRAVDPLLETYGERAVDAILDAISQAELLPYLVERLREEMRGDKR